MKKSLSLAVALMVFLGAQGWAATVPDKITINEIYKNSDGTVPSLATTKRLRVSLYRDSSSTSFWEQDFDQVPLQAGGEFWLILSASNGMEPLPDFSENLWFKVTDRDDAHDAVTLRPLISAPYAKYADHAIHADTADDGVPRGAIIIWILTSLEPTVPDYVLQQYEIVWDFQGSFPRLATTGELFGTGGSSTHSHSFSAKSDENDSGKDVLKPPPGAPDDIITEVAKCHHRHNVDGNTDSVSNIPPYFNIIFLRKR